MTGPTRPKSPTCCAPTGNPIPSASTPMASPGCVKPPLCFDRSSPPSTPMRRQPSSTGSSRDTQDRSASARTAAVPRGIPTSTTTTTRPGESGSSPRPAWPWPFSSGTVNAHRAGSAHRPAARTSSSPKAVARNVATAPADARHANESRHIDASTPPSSQATSCWTNTQGPRRLHPHRRQLAFHRTAVAGRGGGRFQSRYGRPRGPGQGPAGGKPSAGPDRQVR